MGAAAKEGWEGPKEALRQGRRLEQPEHTASCVGSHILDPERRKEARSVWGGAAGRKQRT